MISPESLFDPATGNIFREAFGWLAALLGEPLVTALAVFAIALFGLLLLRGRLHLERAGLVLIGAFILFGAVAISSAIVDRAQRQIGNEKAVVTAGPPPPQPANPVPPSQPFDPYAGASLPQQK
jgi:type IV secretory pathway VirB2 component (pilin)